MRLPLRALPWSPNRPSDPLRRCRPTRRKNGWSVSSSDPIVDDPFDAKSTLLQQAASTAEAPAKPFDESAPMDARVIVGSRPCCDYNYEDPKTGKTKTMEMVRPGEDVRISTVTAVNGGRPPQPVYLTATVVDIFKCGMSEYDSNLVFCNLAELQRVRGMFDPQNPNDPDRKSITSIQIKLKDFADAPEVIERLQAVFPPGHLHDQDLGAKAGAAAWRPSRSRRASSMCSCF